MNEELYTLYQNDASFKEYVDRWCKKHNLSIFEAFRLNVLQEYAKYLKEVKK
jgi:hypothetical protein